MNRKLAFLLLLLGFICSCAKESTLSITAAHGSEADVPICESISCPEITVTYIEAHGNVPIAAKINSKITKYIISSLYIGDDEKPPQATSIVEAIEDFIIMYRTHSAEFPDMAAEYFAEVSVSDIYVSKELVSIEMRNYLFTGGAHGYGTVSFENINPTNGESISTESLFNNLDGFIVFAEQKFREAYMIPEKSNINSTGFWFPNDTFSIPATVGVTKESVILRYNQYDINSYAFGPIEVEISRAEVNEFLNYR